MRRLDAALLCPGLTEHEGLTLPSDASDWHMLSGRDRAGGASSHAEIAQALNEQSIPTRMGKPWSRGTIATIIRREGLPRD
ncbi:hypothetical protein AMJ85_04135 [candidate division BRC1 bacterium SM23_51]|nr:MAG: hypothetical protein AMJ85_04135 [candidate division BRC1 bacterium SM23_51]